jgi:hypothetical protein
VNERIAIFVMGMVVGGMLTAAIAALYSLVSTEDNMECDTK